MEAYAKNHAIEKLWSALTKATDALLRSANLPKGTALLAVGGYGRRELFPYSDIDVLILLPEDGEAPHEPAIVQLLHALWDEQVPMSHAVRSVRDTVSLAAQDATVAAALMDARYLAGERKHYLELKRALKKDVYGHNPRAFVEAKLGERDVRHARYGDSRFLLEPNVKEGKGALRDLQTLNWLARYCYGTKAVTDIVRDDMLSAEEWKHFQKAYLFFANVRGQLHVLRGRADERLSFDIQPAVGEALGFKGKTPQDRAEQLMLRYFQYARAVGSMTRMLCATLEEQQLRAQVAPFVQDNVASVLPEYLKIEAGRLDFSDAAKLSKFPHHGIGLFAAAQEHGLDIHPRAQLALSRALPRMSKRLVTDKQSNQLLLSMLLSEKAPDITLRRMNESGVLGAIVPEFGKLAGQMQYDGYHTYTVDEHILMAIGNLRQLELGNWNAQLPLSTKLAGEGRDRAVLYVAMLCHDIAKGTGGKHAETGADMAREVAARLGLSTGEVEIVGWLVKHHALLSDTAFKRDLDDPKTIEDFVITVQSPERLRLLLLITVADIHAVGPNIFNGWKGALMRTLYHRAMVKMGIGELRQDMEDHSVLIAQWRKREATPAVAIAHDDFRDVTIVTICLATAPKLFATLAGVLTSVGASIVSARIRQLTDSEGEGASLAEFHIQDMHGKNFADDEKRLRKLPVLISVALNDPPSLDASLASRRHVKKQRKVTLRPGVFIDNNVSASASVIEINARDRVGLLHDMLRTLDENALQVLTAHINTYGQLAVDVFYVKDAYGHKLTHNARQAQLQQTLLNVIGATED